MVDSQVTASRGGLHESVNLWKLSVVQLGNLDARIAFFGTDTDRKHHVALFCSW